MRGKSDEDEARAWAARLEDMIHERKIDHEYPRNVARFHFVGFLAKFFDQTSVAGIALLINHLTACTFLDSLSSLCSPCDSMPHPAPLPLRSAQAVVMNAAVSTICTALHNSMCPLHKVVLFREKVSLNS